MADDQDRLGGKPRLLAVSSSGGHWLQLLLLRDAFADHDVTFVCTQAVDGSNLGARDVVTIPDCNRNTHASLARLVLRAARLVRRYRPDSIVSTGALPGLVFILVGRLLGKRTVWIESMANSGELSMSGRWASHIAHECFVQWPELAKPGVTRYDGAVL